ncbi:MAG: hypothetical protein H0V66_04870 [Bdellovibrionales bacterium]|nr:hypothetical protein [Bdellovibrionales bacterium]
MGDLLDEQFPDETYNGFKEARVDLQAEGSMSDEAYYAAEAEYPSSFDLPSETLRDRMSIGEVWKACTNTEINHAWQIRHEYYNSPMGRTALE